MGALNHSIKAGEVVPGEFFVDHKEKKIHITYSHGKGHEATCTIEQGYNLSRNEDNIAEGLKSAGYQLIGARTKEGASSPHLTNFLDSLDINAKETLISVQRKPEFIKESGTAWTELIFAKYWETQEKETSGIVRKITSAIKKIN